MYLMQSLSQTLCHSDEVPLNPVPLNQTSSQVLTASTRQDCWTYLDPCWESSLWFSMLSSLLPGSHFLPLFLIYSLSTLFSFFLRKYMWQVYFWNLENVFTWLTNHAWLIVWLGIEFLVSDHCFSDVSRCLFHCLLAYSVIVEKYNIALISNLFVICFFSLEGFRSFFLSWMLWNSIMMCLSIGHFLFVGYMLQTGSLNLSFIESGLLLTSIGMKRWKREVHNIFQWVTIRNHNKVRGGTPLFFSFSFFLFLVPYSYWSSDGWMCRENIFR